MPKTKYVIPGFNFYYRSLDDYVSNDKKNLNNAIYDCILDYVDNQEVCVDAEDVFNGAYLLCTRVYNDPRPENNFRGKYPLYQNDECFDENVEEVLVWWTTYTMLNYYYKHHGGENIRRFLTRAERNYRIFAEPYYVDVWCKQIEEYIDIENERIEYADNLEWGEGYHIDLTKEDIPMPYDFSLEVPLPFPSEKDPWQEWTSNFDKDVVLYVLDSYVDTNLKLEVLGYIEKAWIYYNEHKNDLPF